MTAAGDLRLGRPAQRMLGGLMLGHFAVVCAIKLATGVAGEILWMSHVGLLLAGTGLVLGRPLLVATALIDILMLHGLWLADCATWWTTGVFPLGITRYLGDATWSTWVATAHHFYLAPLLLVIVRRRAVRAPDTYLAALAASLILTAASRAAVRPALNVNYAFGVNITLPVALVEWGNAQPGAVYLLVLNAVIAVFFITPAYLLLRSREEQDRHMGSSFDESPRCASIGSSITWTTWLRASDGGRRTNDSSTTCL